MKKLNNILIFLLPIFFALPELAFNIEIINLRIDDLIVYILILINVNKIKNANQHLFIRTQYFLLFYVTLSLLVALLFHSELISSYEVVRTFASIPYLIIFPFIFSNETSRKIFFQGAGLGGIIYLSSLAYNYSIIMGNSEIQERYSTLKSEMSFSTLNPNAVATLALILGWINILAFFERQKKYYIVIGILLLLVPFFVLARGSSVGLISSILIFFFILKGSIKKYFYLSFIILIGFLFIKYFIDSELLVSATNINVETGAGFSGRYTLWNQGVQLVEMAPFLGHGFGTENGLYIKYFHGHMAHQILLHYAIELGVIILIIFLISIFYLLKDRFLLYKNSRNIIYLIQFAIFICFFIADLSDQLLYFNKYAFIIYAIVVYRNET